MAREQDDVKNWAVRGGGFWQKEEKHMPDPEWLCRLCWEKFFCW
jgi:hypothetical protein